MNIMFFLSNPIAALVNDNSNSELLSGGAVTSVNGKTGNVKLTAEDVGAVDYITFSGLSEAVSDLDLAFERHRTGMRIDEIQMIGIPLEHNTIVKHTVTADEVIEFETALMTAEKSITMELWLTMPEEVVSFTMPDVTWIEEPSFDTANTLYAVVIRWDGEKVIGNVAYTLEVS